MAAQIQLRDVREEDVTIFFEQQSDPVARQMVAFTPHEPADREAFKAKWARVLSDESIIKRTIERDGQVVGNVLSFLAPWSGQQEVGYWIDRSAWGQGIASTALAELLQICRRRPLFATVAADNLGSIRVLQKCGFAVCGHGRNFANARGCEIDEVMLRLTE